MIEDELNQQVDFSFNSDDSFEAIISGPQIRPRKPSFVPHLDLDCLPEYISSSDEDQASEKDNHQTPM